MLRRARLLLVLALLAPSGCSQRDAPASEPRHPVDSTPPAPSPAPPDAAPAQLDAACPSRPSAWCASPPGDPCGEHRDVPSCRADSRCKGMRYTGESFVACKDDGTGFSSNCPNVGCISR